MEARELWQQVLFWEAEHHKTHCKLLKSLDRVKVLLQTEWEKEEKTKKKAEKKLRKAEKKEKQLRKAEEKRLEAEKKKAEQKEKQLRKAEKKRLEAEKKKAEQKQKQLRKAEEKRLAGEKRKKAEQKEKKRLKAEKRKKAEERNREAQRPKPCIYCAAPGITREHLVPKSVGGKCTVPCCLACNRNRGNKTPADYPPLYRYIRTREGATHWAISMKAAKKNVKDAPRLKEKLEDWMKGIYTPATP